MKSGDKVVIGGKHPHAGEIGTYDGQVRRPKGLYRVVIGAYTFIARKVKRVK